MHAAAPKLKGLGVASQDQEKAAPEMVSHPEVGRDPFGLSDQQETRQLKGG